MSGQAGDSSLFLLEWDQDVLRFLDDQEQVAESRPGKIGRSDNYHEIFESFLKVLIGLCSLYNW